jgi:hypothetical protein
VRLGAGDASSPSSFTVCNDVAVSTYDPPCKQWLTAVGAGAVVPVSRGDWSVVVAVVVA